MVNILQIKVTIDGITPKIWRRFLVKDNISFDELHNVIQTVMGWGNYHLYAFYLGKEEIGIPDTDFRDNLLNAKKIKLKDKLSIKQKFGYVYDFGDNWEHILSVEKVMDNKDVTMAPTCLGGERAGPPEDCGSYPGYYELMKIKKNKKHPEYKERIVEWLGKDFDFEYFNLEEINKQLLKLIKADGRTRYWVKK
jgi:hypothetical protein